MVENEPLGTVTSVRSERANAGGAQADVFNGAHAVAKLAEVAHRDGPVTDDGDAAEKIFDGLLRREGQGDAADTESREERGGVVAPFAENGRDDQHEHQQS